MEPDHNNLRWIEQSRVPKVIRWVAIMQSFQFVVIKHRPGKLNVLSLFLALFQHLIITVYEVVGDSDKLFPAS